jgi:hypothetical protein
MYKSSVAISVNIRVSGEREADMWPCLAVAANIISDGTVDTYIQLATSSRSRVCYCKVIYFCAVLGLTRGVCR